MKAEEFLAAIRERARKKGAPVRGDSRDSVTSGHSVDSISENVLEGRDTGEELTADIAILTAMHSPEAEKAIEVFGTQWRRVGKEGVVFNVCDCDVGGSAARVVVAVQNDPGMVDAAILATKTLRAWKPSILAMCGICAGNRDEVNLGDVVVAKQVFDYGSGKLENGMMRPDYQPITMGGELVNYASALAADRERLAGIRELWPMPKTGCPDTELRAHVGAMASGAAVVADDSVVVGILEHKRSLIGIDMEAFGVARAAFLAKPETAFVVVKGVQDYADVNKNETYREYAAFVGAWFLKLLLNDLYSAT